MKKYNSVHLIGRLMRKNRKILKKSTSLDQLSSEAVKKDDVSGPKLTSMIEKLKRLKKIGKMIPGGDGKAKKIEDFDPQLMWEGIQEEMEHTDDVRVATEIAIDHLSKDRDYYKKLKSCGID